MSEKKLVKFICKGYWAYMKGEITRWEMEEIKALPKMAMADIEDLNLTHYFYGKGKVAVGVAERVAEFLRSRGYETKIVNAKYQGEKYKWEFLGEYREGQKEIIDTYVKHKRGVQTATTGAGKTVMLTSTVCQLGVPALVLSYNVSPNMQVVEAFKKFTDIPEERIHIWASGQKPNKLSPYIVAANIDTVLGILSRADHNDPRYVWLVETCGLIFVDECHHAASDGSQQLFRSLCRTPDATNVTYLMGTTATYRRSDGRDPYLEATFGESLRDQHYGESIDLGRSVPSDIYCWSVQPRNYQYTAQRGVHRNHRMWQFRKVYNDYIVEGSTGRNDLIVDKAYEEMEAGRTVLISLTRVEHAEELRRRIPEASLIVASGRKKTSAKERERILDKFRHREIQCVISTLLREGVDIPSLDTTILAGGGKATGPIEQSLRHTRICDTELRTGHYKKERGFVHYFIDHADFLTTHSREAVKFLKEYASLHPENNLYIDGEKQCLKGKQPRPAKSTSSDTKMQQAAEFLATIQPKCTETSTVASRRSKTRGTSRRLTSAT